MGATAEDVTLAALQSQINSLKASISAVLTRQIVPGNVYPVADLPIKAASGLGYLLAVDPAAALAHRVYLPEINAASSAVGEEIGAMLAAAQQSMDAAVAEAGTQVSVLLASMGYLVPVPYTEGLEVDSARYTVTYDGGTYAPVTDAVPFITGVEFNPAQWRLIQGVTAADLSTGAGAAMLGWQQDGTGAITQTVLSTLRRVLAPEDYGAAGDGGIDDTVSMKALAIMANATKRPIKFGAGRRYRVTGADDLVFYYSVDGNGSTFDLSEFTGKIYFLRPPEAQPVTYGATSAVVTALAGQTVPRGTQHITQWQAVTEIDDAYLVIRTTEPFYNYRGTDINRIERMRSFRRGGVEIPLRYALSGDRVTSVEVYPNIGRIDTIKDLNFYSDKGPLANTVTVSRTNVEVRNVRFVDENMVMVEDTQWLVVHTTFNFLLEDCNYSWSLLRTNDGTDTGTLLATYCLGMWDSYDVRFRGIRAAGPGWGPVAIFETSNISWDECVLGRVDSHTPFRNFMRITNSLLLDDCVRVQGIGDLIIDNCYLTNDTAKNFNQASPGVINTRGDSGGFITGDVIIRNSRIRMPIDTNGRIITFEAPSNGSVHPTGSPIPWRSCGSFQMLDCEVESADGRITNLAPVDLLASRPAPEHVVIDHVRGARVRFQYTLPTVAYSPIASGVLAASGYNMHVSINDVAIADQLQIIDPTVDTGYVCNVAINNVRPASGSAPNAAVVKVRGKTVVSNSTLDYHSTMTGSAVTYWSLTQLRDVSFYPTAPVLVRQTSNPNQVLKASGCVVYGGTDANRAALAYADAVNCSGADANGAPSEIYLTTDFGGTSGDKGLLGSGAQYSVRGRYKVITDTGEYLFHLPKSGSESIHVPTGNGAYITVKRNTALNVINLTGASVSNFRYVAIDN